MMTVVMKEQLKIHESVLPWLQEKRDEIDAVIMDVDGVLIRSCDAMPGSREFVQWLHQQHIPHLLLTNDGSSSPQQKAARLNQCGIDFKPEQIISASHGLIELTAERGWRGELFFMIGTLGDPCYAREAGLETTSDLNCLDQCRGIILAEGDYDWENVLTHLFNFLLLHPDIPLILPNPDEYFPGRDGFLHIASGAIGRFICKLCAVGGVKLQPLYLGKPYEPIFLYSYHCLCKRAEREIPRSRILMIGDSISGDIAGGAAFGCRTGLVLSGITTIEMWKNSDIIPDAVFEHL